MRLIDADALVKALQDDIEGLEEEFQNDKQVKAYKCGVEMALAYIGTEPTIDDVAPVRHGHWIKISPAGIYECSECQKNVMTSDIEAYVWCHGCGAMMDGGELNDNAE